MSVGRDRAQKTLDRVLSRAGACSRTQAAEMIRAGRVTVDGAVARDPARWVDPARSRILLDGRPVEPPREHLYLAFHKPAGCVTTRSDPEGRKTVYDFLGDVGAWVAPVGRLDLETSGLLLLTNDTVWADRIMNPDSGIPKTYRVRARGGLTEEKIRALREGVLLDDGKTLPARVTVTSANAKRTLLDLTITEGKNRQVRRMLSAVGSKVLALERVSIGPVLLAGIAPGAWRPLAPGERSALSDASSPR